MKCNLCGRENTDPNIQFASLRNTTMVCLPCLRLPAPPPFISLGLFCVVYSGETYFTEITPGTHLLSRILVNCYGQVADCSQELVTQWLCDLAEPDNWSNHYDGQPGIFNQDIGETDHIQIIRLTEKEFAASLEYHEAIKGLLELWPLSPEQLHAYCAATFIPAALAAYKKTKP